MTPSPRKKLSGFTFRPVDAAGNAKTTKVVGQMPSRGAVNVSKGTSLRSRDATADKTHSHHVFSLTKKNSSYEFSRVAFPRKEQLVTPFISTHTEKLTKIRSSSQPPVRKAFRNGQTRRLSATAHLELLQALVNEPLTFLDLHARFGVSKRTMEGFVTKGLSKEVWGDRAIGVWFELTSKGKKRLKELEAAAEVEPQIKQRKFIRLKTRAQNLF